MFVSYHNGDLIYCHNTSASNNAQVNIHLQCNHSWVTFDEKFDFAVCGAEPYVTVYNKNGVHSAEFVSTRYRAM